MSPPEKPAEPAEPTAADDADGPTDDTREKFREALARKKDKEQGVPHHAVQAGTSGRSQDAKTQRMFRRKSG